MYFLYEKTRAGTSTRYSSPTEISLFGCNVGYIPKFLRLRVRPDQGEPFKWSIPVAEFLARQGQPGTAIVIDLKPTKRDEELSFYELEEIWGYSDRLWTPVMFWLKGLFVDEIRDGTDWHDFVVEDDKACPAVLSLTYIDGTVRNGTLDGRWTPPKPGSTNSVLLWPLAWEYFKDQATKLSQKNGPPV